ncbi:heavy-metal-associated domain-containing protein [Mucilaginibacter daejeonensis]|uniref:heavy-metal-associated domain-containing protein n=1 Tax=Mucilaginibacter daejeonensis TaxID=398049 RepID=UPI001D177E73|nr:heavy-metal-associated domain-containing protein [Mucilaginibacter daejeonensis]UEG53237.1 heavy-metal-associated domain-containing protein [Mucilaginibacter daejeonensis]
MKTLKIFLFLLAVSIGAAKAQFVKAELQVSGLTCSMCSKATEKSLSSLPFIAAVKPDLNRNLFTITFKSNTPVDLEQMSKKVQGAGFSINQLTTTVDLGKLKLNNNTFNYAGDTFHILNGNTKSLDGQVNLTVVNKGFAPAATVKKYSDAANSKTGNGKNYHVII